MAPFRNKAKKMASFVRRRYGSTSLRKFNYRKLARDVSYVKSVVNSELKHSDTTNTFTPYTAGLGWQVIDMISVAQGDLENQRNGSQIRVKSLQIRGKMRRGASVPATIPADRVRMVLFVDHQPLISGTVGTNPVLLDMFSTDDVDSLRSWQSTKIKRFTVLKDVTFKLDSDDPEKLIKLYKRLNLSVKYSAATTADAIISNNMYIAFFCDNPSTTIAERPNVELITRITYRDN